MRERRKIVDGDGRAMVGPEDLVMGEKSQGRRKISRLILKQKKNFKQSKETK